MTERFDLLEEVGHGAMGVVWRARDNERHKIVAIKMLRDLHLDDPEYVERFASEVDLARSVRSPHVVRVRGYGVRQSVPFVVLEFVDGQSLRARIIEKGPFGPAEARDLLVQVAEALTAVHAVGIVHRDVKASNVLLTKDGVAKLTDFGIARGREATKSTRIGSLLGTPAYMAPEGPVDARSDLYSLGVLYYEILTGVLPFTGANYHEVIRAHELTMPDLSLLAASERGLTGWLLSKKPGERPRSAEVLLASLAAGVGRTNRFDADPTANTAYRPEPRPSLPIAVSAPNPTYPARPISPTAMVTPLQSVPASASRAAWPRDATHTTPPHLAPVRRSRGPAIAAGATAVAAVLVLGAVVALSAMGGATDSASGSGTSSSGGSADGTMMIVIAVLILAFGAVAVTVALAMTRARTRRRALRPAFSDRYATGPGSTTARHPSGR